MNPQRQIKIALGLLIAGALVASCAGATEPTDEPLPATSATATPSGDSPAPGTGTPLTDNQAMTVMEDLVSDNIAVSRSALGSVLVSGDPHFVAVLLEMMRAHEIGLVRGPGYTQVVNALETISGQAFGPNWRAWVEWYGQTELTPPAGFTGWKGRLLGRLDPGFAEFLQDDFPAQLRVEEIQWGGVYVDGIPALDNPNMVSAAEADYLIPEEPVFGIMVNGDARAYPLRILDWHEMANDVVGGVPVSLAYCTLCGAGIAFDGRLPGMESLTFGSSGFLYRSNKLMYDRQTRTLWNQLTGEPVLGPLAAEDLRLDLLPVVLTAWADWQEQHPETKVVGLETGHSRNYELGAAYGDYFSDSDTMFPVAQRSDLLPAKARIYALRWEGTSKAYELQALVDEQVVNDQVGDTPMVLVAQHGRVTVRGENQRVGPVSYDAGGEVRAYLRRDWTFEPGVQVDELLDQQGRIWRMTEQALEGPQGESLSRINGHLAYWFGWFAFFPNTELYTADDIGTP